MSIDVLVVGKGFVGAAVCHGFQKNRVDVADPKLGTSVKDFRDKKYDLIFIAVPTPMGTDGVINASIVQEVMPELAKHKEAIIVLKSTLIPSMVDELAKKYKNFVYNPEFLTERNALWDFENPILHVFGGSPENTSKLHSFYERYSICKPAPVHYMTAQEAAFTKYGINTFLSTKVLFWNQFYDLCKTTGADYDTIRRAIGEDARVGSSHMMVPGNDGKRGFSGACFPKDSAAMIRFAQEQKTPLTVLEEATRQNMIYRAGTELDDREKEQGVSYDVKI